jgi:hypothetical protein
MVDYLDRFKKLYAALLDAVKDYPGDICTFFPHKGEKYGCINKKLLFVGISANSWLNDSRDVDELFDLQKENRIVNRDDVIKRLENNEVPGYNTNRSAYLRIYKKLVKAFYDKEDWFSYIAWSNVYKISPCAGKSPPGLLRHMQEALCVEILNEEIRVLKPDFVIFLSSPWEEFYLESIGLDPRKNQSKTWDAYVTHYQTKDGVTYIMSPQPQGKKEEPHIAALLEILRANK